MTKAELSAYISSIEDKWEQVDAVLDLIATSSCSDRDSIKVAATLCRDNLKYLMECFTFIAEDERERYTELAKREIGKEGNNE